MKIPPWPGKAGDLVLMQLRDDLPDGPAGDEAHRLLAAWMVNVVRSMRSRRRPIPADEMLEKVRVMQRAAQQLVEKFQDPSLEYWLHGEFAEGREFQQAWFYRRRGGTSPTAESSGDDPPLPSVLATLLRVREKADAMVTWAQKGFGPEDVGVMHWRRQLDQQIRSTLASVGITNRRTPTACLRRLLPLIEPGKPAQIEGLIRSLASTKRQARKPKA